MKKKKKKRKRKNEWETNKQKCNNEINVFNSTYLSHTYKLSITNKKVPSKLYK